MKLHTMVGSAVALLALSASAQAQSPAPRIDPTWLSWKADTKTATFALEAGAPAAKSPFNFNGFVDGELTFVVPLASTVVINFVNEDGVPHSAEVISGTAPIPNTSIAPNVAIPRAYTRKALEGMNQGEKDVMRFTAQPAGDYRIFCGVPGHGISGMWIRFKVDATATQATMLYTPKKN